MKHGIDRAGSRFLVFAHRGYPSMRPENTMPSFELGAKSGADGIELDARLTRDGKAVVYHDDDLGRITGRTGPLEKKDWSYLRRLDAGKHFSEKFKDTRIPALDEVLEIFSGRLIINIELKPGRPGGRRLAREVIKTARKYSAMDGIIFSSFDPVVLEWVRKIEPVAIIGLLWEEEHWRKGLKIARRLGARYFNPSIDLASGELAGEASRAGMRCLVYTVNSTSECDRLVKSGYGGVFTDVPGKIVRYMRNFNR